MTAACSAGDLATASVTVVAGLGAAVVLIIQALRRNPPWRRRGDLEDNELQEDDPDG